MKACEQRKVMIDFSPALFIPYGPSRCGSLVICVIRSDAVVALGSDLAMLETFGRRYADSHTQ